MNQDTAEKLLRAAVDFAALSASARETCRETYRRNERETDNTLRILVDGQVASLGLAMSQKIAAVSESTSYQIGVSASFIRTHFVLGDHILNGDLVEALTLIRKQLESVARLHELDSTPLQKLAGKVPNIKSVLARQAARVYGDLSEVAHFSTSRVSALLHVLQDGDRIGPGLVPSFTERAFACFDLVHFITVYFIAWMLEKLPVWYPKFDASEARETFMQTVDLAIRTDVIRMPAQSA